jgi:hypothetical protein
MVSRSPVRLRILTVSTPKLLGAVLGFAALFPAIAADQTGNYEIMGPGSKSCGTYNDARKRGSDASFQFWIAGYITGTNIYLPDTVDITGSTDLPGVMGWLDNWCRENPTRQFANAMNALTTFLYPNRMKKQRAP